MAVTKTYTENIYQGGTLMFTYDVEITKDGSNFTVSLHRSYYKSWSNSADVSNRTMFQISGSYNGTSFSYWFYPDYYNVGEHGSTRREFKYDSSNPSIAFNITIRKENGDQEDYTSQYSNTWWYLTIPTLPPTATIYASNVCAGKTANISWNISDPEKEIIYTDYLYRYYKPSGSSSFTRTSLGVSGYAVSSGQDSIPTNYAGGQIYYTVGFHDHYNPTQTATSPTYTISVPNSAPTTPGVPAVPDKIKEGDAISVSWGASSDADGNLAGYQLQASLDNGSWTTVYTGASTAIAYTVPKGTKYIAFRVCAYDSSNAYSGYATTATFEVVSALSGYISVNQIQRNIVGGYAFVDGVAREVVGAYVCVNGVWRLCYGS